MLDLHWHELVEQATGNIDACRSTHAAEYSVLHPPHIQSGLLLEVNVSLEGFMPFSVFLLGSLASFCSSEVIVVGSGFRLSLEHHLQLPVCRCREKHVNMHVHVCRRACASVVHGGCAYRQGCRATSLHQFSWCIAFASHPWELQL